MKASELRRVGLYFKGGDRPAEHFMHQDQVETFLKACLELHYQPGRNPYTGGKTSELWYVVSESISEPTQYWWTTLGLGKTRPALGALVSSFSSNYTRLWTHPDLLKKEEQDALAENEAERRMELGELG
jgi:hypothetical protein